VLWHGSWSFSSPHFPMLRLHPPSSSTESKLAKKSYYYSEALLRQIFSFLSWSERWPDGNGIQIMKFLLQLDLDFLYACAPVL
jgi:hypothetical protein